MADAVAQGVPVLSKDPLALREFTALLAGEWDGLRRESPELAVDESATTAILALPLGDVYAISEVKDKFGFAMAGAAFLIAAKALATKVAPHVAAKFGDAVLGAAARELVSALIRRVQKENGDDYLTRAPAAPPKA